MITSGVDSGYEYSFTADVQDEFSEETLKNVPVKKKIAQTFVV